MYDWLWWWSSENVGNVTSTNTIILYYIDAPAGRGPFEMLCVWNWGQWWYSAIDIHWLRWLQFQCLELQRSSKCPQWFLVPVVHIIATYGYGSIPSIPINTIFRGMNIHKSQLFWCAPGVHGFDPLPYHCHTLSPEALNAEVQPQHCSAAAATHGTFKSCTSRHLALCSFGICPVMLVHVGTCWYTIEGILDGDEMRWRWFWGEISGMTWCVWQRALIAGGQ